MNEELLQRLEREAEKITLDMPASLDDREFTAVFNAEFARLIVSECIDQCFTDGDAERIAIHFGIDISEEE